MSSSPLKCNSEMAMQKAGWKINQNDEACYIDIEENSDKEKEDDEPAYSNWSYLPDLILEKIYTYLTPRERYYASLVCTHWYRALYLPTVWNNFIVDDRTLTRQRYNYYSGWQYCLDHTRTQNCIARIGRYLRGVEFHPDINFNNIYQFITMLSWSMEKSLDVNGPKELKGVGERIQSLVYIFPCNMAQADDPDGVKLFGTGGQLLKGLKELLSKLQNLRTLKLVDFVLERYEAKHLLDEVVELCFLKMRVLNLVNVTTMQCPILHVGLFINLQILTMSPQNIDDDVLMLLADTKLKHLHILQNCYTPLYVTISYCSVKAWRMVKCNNPTLKVHLRLESFSDGELVIQREAPVYSITYKAPKVKIHPDAVLNIIDNYKHTLTIYGYESFPSYISPKSFHSRIDSLMMLICRECYNLNTLLIRERVSTSTILVLVHAAKNLRYLYVRREAVIIKCDWPRHIDWSDEFYKWLRHCSRSYEAVEVEVSQIFGHYWHFLTDQEYKELNIDVQNL